MLSRNKRRRLTIRGLLSLIVVFVAARAFLRGNYEHLLPDKFSLHLSACKRASE